MKKIPVIEFTVPGKPVPMPRPRLSGSRVFVPPAVAIYKDTIALVAKSTALWLESDVGVRIIFRVKSRKADIDNLVKSVLDALNGIVYKDDRQVVWLEATLYRVTDNESTTITIYRIEQ